VALLGVTSEIRVQQRAELVAYPADESADFDPHGFTALVGIHPTSIHLKGEVMQSGRTRPFSAWMYETADRIEPDTEVVVQEVLDRFEPVAPELREARTRWGLELQVGLVICVYGSIRIDPDGATGAVVASPALYFSPRTLGRLTELGCSVDIDTYVKAPQ
jgi:hypothetical protein